jgi:hypothetical protein
MDELSPLLRALAEQPTGFLGGFFAGLFRLNLAEDPVKGWLTAQIRKDSIPVTATAGSNGNGRGPQAIAID